MLHYPVDEPPPFATPVPIADGVLWMRLAIPYRLNHVNVYLLRDQDGWLAVDTGVDDAPTHEAWSRVLGQLGGPHALTRIILTHHHPDHAGAAGWLQQTTNAHILTSESEWNALGQSNAPGTEERLGALAAHFRWLGCDAEEALAISHEKLRSWEHVGPRPQAWSPIGPTGEIVIGARRWNLLPGAGHSPGAVLLHDRAGGLLIAGDQILPTISPYVGTPPERPQTSPLAEFIGFLDRIVGQVDAEPLVLPGHGLPFHGLAERVAELKAHHGARCRLILERCRTPATTRALIDTMFKTRLNGVMGMALDETLSHVNLLARRGWLEASTDDGVLRLLSGGGASTGFRL